MSTWSWDYDIFNFIIPIPTDAKCTYTVSNLVKIDKVQCIPLSWGYFVMRLVESCSGKDETRYHAGS